MSEVSRADRLRADGWTECGTCDGHGYALPDEEPDRGWSGRCTDCAHGLVPPDGMVEAAAKAILESDELPKRAEWWLWAAYAALVAAARWEAPDE